MPTSPSLILGYSFLPSRVTSDFAFFIRRTANAVKRNPDVAVEITLAATAHLLENLEAPAELRRALSQLVSESCKARDASTHA